MPTNGNGQFCTEEINKVVNDAGKNDTLWTVAAKCFKTVFSQTNAVQNLTKGLKNEAFGWFDDTTGNATEHIRSGKDMDSFAYNDLKLTGVSDAVNANVEDTGKLVVSDGYGRIFDGLYGGDAAGINWKAIAIGIGVFVVVAGTVAAVTACCCCKKDKETAPKTIDVENAPHDKMNAGNLEQEVNNSTRTLKVAPQTIENHKDTPHSMKRVSAIQPK